MGSLYLCSMPNFWTGVARLLDFGNSYDLYNQTATAEQADGIGMMMDWQMVREDLWQAVYNYDSEVKSVQENCSDEVELAHR